MIVEVLASPYKRARVLAFIDPWKDPQNTGFHIVQSLLALGSGGIFGLGLGASRAKFFYLPEQYTDFIFSILGEELGLIGALAVVMLFVVFAYRAIKIAIAAPDRFGFFLAIGCMAVVVIQAFVNIGVVTSSWPVTGVPLPFISFGGSSLIVNLVAVALIVNVGRGHRVTSANVSDDPVERHLEQQIEAFEIMRSPLYAQTVKLALADYRAGGVMRRFFERNPARKAMSTPGVRLMGALHFLALRGEAPEIARHLPSCGGDADAQALWNAMARKL